MTVERCSGYADTVLQLYNEWSSIERVSLMSQGAAALTPPNPSMVMAAKLVAGMGSVLWRKCEGTRAWNSPPSSPPPPPPPPRPPHSPGLGPHSSSSPRLLCHCSCLVSWQSLNRPSESFYAEHFWSGRRPLGPRPALSWYHKI